MPEGPEIRRAADKIAKVIQHQVIEHIEVGLPNLEPFISKLKGRVVTEVETRGKAMITHFDNRLSIYSHNQLYGKWLTSERGKYPNTNRSLRLALHTISHSAILYSASDISVWERGDLHRQPLLSKLGPDVLHQETSASVIQQRLISKRFKNRSLSSLYLDQHFLAGVGNYLRSEILFDCSLHPEKKPAQLTEQQLSQLALSTLSITMRSYKTGGYTVSGSILNSIRTPSSSYEGTRFMVFDREQLPCRKCGELIHRAITNSRRIYWCPTCQPST